LDVELLGFFGGPEYFPRAVFRRDSFLVTNSLRKEIGTVMALQGSDFFFSQELSVGFRPKVFGCCSLKVGYLDDEEGNPNRLKSLSGTRHSLSTAGKPLLRSPAGTFQIDDAFASISDSGRSLITRGTSATLIHNQLNSLQVPATSMRLRVNFPPVFTLCARRLFSKQNFLAC